VQLRVHDHRSATVGGGRERDLRAERQRRGDPADLGGQCAPGADRDADGFTLGTTVSTKFVARALERFAQRLGAAGFDEAMAQALRAEDVLCAEETPTNVIHKDTDAHDEPVPGSPHAVTVRTPDARLVWYAPIGSRSKTAITGLGVLEGYTGYLVRDDYAS
jgi:hypothetical protein